jgi:hypothetical protein
MEIRDLHCFSACSSWPTVLILTTVMTRPISTNPFKFGLQPHFQWSIFNPAFAVRNATAHAPPAPPSPLLPTASATPYFLRASDPSANFFTRPSPSCFILTFGRPSSVDHPQARAFFSSGDHSTALFEDYSNTVWHSGDFRHNLHIFAWLLLGPSSPLQI